MRLPQVAARDLQSGHPSTRCKRGQRIMLNCCNNGEILPSPEKRRYRHVGIKQKPNDDKATSLGLGGLSEGLSDAMADRTEKGAIYPAIGPVLRRPYNPRDLLSLVPAAARHDCYK